MTQKVDSKGSSLLIDNMALTTKLDRLTKVSSHYLINMEYNLSTVY